MCKACLDAAILALGEMVPTCSKETIRKAHHFDPSYSRLGSPSLFVLGRCQPICITCVAYSIARLLHCLRPLRVTISQIAMRCIWIVKVLAIVLLVPLLANLVTVLIAIANGSTSWTLLVVHTVLVFVMTLTAVIRCLFLREVRPDRQGEVPVTVQAGDRPVAATRRMEKDQQQVSAISPPPHTVVSCRNAANQSGTFDSP